MQRRTRLKMMNTKKKVKAKKALENYVYKIGNTINDKKISAKIDPASKKKIKDAIEQVIQWLGDLQLVGSGLYDKKLKWLQIIFIPIRIYGEMIISWRQSLQRFSAMEVLLK